MSTVKLSGKPEGATHYAIYNGSVGWYKLTRTTWQIWFRHEWKSVNSAAVPAAELVKIIIDDQEAVSVREESVTAMMVIYEKKMNPDSPRLGHASRPAMEAVYDAGYRLSK